MLGEVITRARKNNIPYDKEMKYDFHSHGHSYLVLKDGELTLLEDPSEKHGEEISLNGFFELYFSKEEVKSKHQIGKWYKHKFGALFCVTSINDDGVLYGYGFDKHGHWFSFIDESSTSCACNNTAKAYTVEATHQEVEKALIEEAKRIGFKGGFVFDDRTNILWNQQENGEERAILSNGKWVTIIEQDKFAELKEAHRNGAVIQVKFPRDCSWTDLPSWAVSWSKGIEYRIKPEEGLKIGDKVIGIRTDCAIVGEVTSVSKKKVCVNNLAFLKDQVSPLTAVQYDDVRFLINGFKGHD